MEKLKKISQAYRATAIMIFNICVVFLVLNIGMFLFYSFKDKQVSTQKNNPVARKYDDVALKKVYPHMSKEAIDELLMETWSRPYIYDSFTLFKEIPYKGRYVNVDENGFRITKNQGPWPPASGNLNIFLFGGSTVFGYGVSDDQTIASYLQDFLSNRLQGEVRVYNFGRGSYFSYQEHILFEKLLISGVKPDLAIFIDGYNDFYLLDGRPAFSDQIEKVFLEKHNGQKRPASTVVTELIGKLPVSRLARSLRSSLKQIRNYEVPDESASVTQTKEITVSKDHHRIVRVIDRYIENKTITEAVAYAYNVNTLFVWQPVPSYKYDPMHHVFASIDSLLHEYVAYGYRYMEGVLKKKDLGDNFLWAADIQEHSQQPLYIDIAHYSAEMSKMLSEYVGYHLLDRNILSNRR